MTTPIVSQADLQRVHHALQVTVPLDQASPLILTTLAVVAHCWLKKNDRTRLTPPTTNTPNQAISHVARRALPACQQQLPIDLKRRAAADYD